MLFAAMVAGPAQAASFNADPSNAPQVIQDAANADAPGSVNVVTLAAGSYPSLSIPAIQGGRRLTLAGGGVSTALTNVTTSSGTVALAQLSVQNVNAAGPLIADRIQAHGQIAAGGLTLTDSSVDGTTDPLVQINAGPSLIRRSKLRAMPTNRSLNANGTLALNVDNSVLIGGINTAGNVTLSLNQVTQSSSTASVTASGGVVNARNSILWTAPSAVNGATIICSFTGVPSTAQSNCAPTANNNSQNPASQTDEFADGDMHLKAGAPAIDHGSGEALNGDNESTTDLDGRPRLVAYDNCRAPLRDLGAYEVPTTAHPPAVGISGPTSAQQRTLSQYTATGADAGTSELTWTFGDGGTILGPNASHVWINSGKIGVTLKAKSANDCVTFAQVLVDVAPAPLPPGPPDKTPPKVTHVKLSSTKLKAGPNKKIKLRIQINEPTVVIATVIRRDNGVFVGGRCLKHKKGRRGRGCLRDHPLTAAGFQIGPSGRFTVPLTLGKLSASRYVLQLETADLAKNKGPTKRLGFTVSNPKKKPTKKR